jgi:hypothetical protein
MERSDGVHKIRMWIAMNATHVRTEAAISTRNGVTADFAISPRSASNPPIRSLIGAYFAQLRYS